MRSTMQDVANAANVSRMTVSLALRNHPSIPPATRTRIAEAAEQLNYRPNPLVAALMSELRSKRGQSAAATIAYITSHQKTSDWQISPTYKKFFEGASQRAQALGFKLEEFVLNGEALPAERLTKVLWNRNIRGLILAPAPNITSAFNLDWSLFSVVAMGYSIMNLQCHRVSSHHRQAMTTALEELRRCGYQRIGIVLHRGDNARVDHSWLAGYDIFNRLHKGEHGIPTLLVDRWSKREFLDWFDTHRPDAIASLQSEIPKWLKEHGVAVPEEVGFAHLGLHPEESALSGTVQHCEEIGATAVDVVVEELNHNHLGIPNYPKLIFIGSDWRAGTSTRPAPPLPPPPNPLRPKRVRPSTRNHLPESKTGEILRKKQVVRKQAKEFPVDGGLFP